MEGCRLVVVALTVLNGCLAAGIMFLRTGSGITRRRPVQLHHVLLAGVCCGCVLLGAFLVHPRLGLHFFGLVSLAYVHAVVLLPILGLLLLLHGRRRPRGAQGPGVSRPVKALAATALFAAPVGIYASFVEPYHLHVEHVQLEVPAVSTESQPIRIALLADIQTDRVSDYEREAITKLMAERPDVILILGDVVQAPADRMAELLPKMNSLLRRLHAPGGVFAVLGDMDTSERMRALYADTDVRLLVNEIAVAHCRGREILIGGCERHFKSRAATKMMDALARRGGPEAIRILMSHVPDAVRFLPEGIEPDLVVAGHTHGGQVRLPFLGPLITFSALPRANCVGLSRYGGVPLYVSRGVGVERGQAPPLRFLCPPEITIIELQADHTP